MNQTRPKNEQQPVMRHYGVTLGFYAPNGYFRSAAGDEEVDRIASLGIPWVCLVVTVLQDRFSSERQYADFRVTPSDLDLRHVIDRLHSHGIKVQLRPMLECWDGGIRLHVQMPREFPKIGDQGLRANPVGSGTKRLDTWFWNEGTPAEFTPYSSRLVKDYWTPWFEGMVDRTLHYAALAERSGCEAYGLDSELDCTVDQNEGWKRVIAAARSVYSGHLTTSHTRNVDFQQELKRTKDHWFKDLDSLGVSFYHPISSHEGATLGEMTEGARREILYYREVAELLGKPFYFGESGCCSTSGATRNPAGWDNPGGYDGEEQRRYLEAVLTAYEQEPWWGGIYWWKWEEQNDRPWLRDDPRGDKGFPIWNKPAALFFKQWLQSRGASAATPKSKQS